MTVACPSCSGPKSARAKLCRNCRRAANVAGEAAILGLITSGQMRAFYAKANALDGTLGRLLGTAKREALARAGVASTTQLTERQASDAIDWLDEQLHASPA